MSIPINDSFYPQVDHFDQYQEVYPTPVSMPNPLSASMPISIPISHHGHYQQPRQFPYPPFYRAVSPDFVARGRVSQACENCKFRKVKCNGASPCERCACRALQCVYGERKVRGPTKKRKERRNAAVQQVIPSSTTVSFFCFLVVGSF